MAKTQQKTNFNIDRFKALSDGVIAVAMTILVLDLKLPDALTLTSSSALWAILQQHEMDIIAYLISFVVIARYWYAHYTTFNKLEYVDKTLIRINTVFLLTITFIPFPVSILSRSDTSLATIFYNISLILPSSVLAYMNCFIAKNPDTLFEANNIHESKEQFARYYYRNALNSLPVVVVAIISTVACLFSNELGAYAWIMLVFSGKIMHFLQKITKLQ